MPKAAKGHIEQLPSGSYRVVVFAGWDPVTRRRLYFKKTVKDETQAKIVLGKLLEKATAGRQPDKAVLVSQLLDEYAPVAEWGVSTRQTNEGFIRRTIKPAIGHLEVRKVRGPILDKLYAQLKRCGDLTCTGQPFTEHRNIPVLAIDQADPRPGWQQVADALRHAIASGTLGPGDVLPSITEMKQLQDIGTGIGRRALEVLADEGLIVARRGQAPAVAGDSADGTPVSAHRRPSAGHHCQRAGCQPHICHPMEPSTIRGIHSILSGAFAAAQRWDWIDWNPADSAKPPTTVRKPVPATPPEDIARLITQARAHSAALGLYTWLAAITGVRRGELCGLQLTDMDLDRGLIHIAFNYVVRGGQKVRKDTKTHQDRWLAIDPVTCALTADYLAAIHAELSRVGLELPSSAYLFSNDAMHARPWNPDWATHQVSDIAHAAGVDLDVKSARHYTASQLLAASFDLRNVAARLGHSGGGATTLKHYADPVPEVDRRAAAYLAELTADAIRTTSPKTESR